MNPELAVATLTPILVKGIPFIWRRGSKFFIADVAHLPQKDVPIRILNGVAYGSFAFSVYNRKLAHFYNKYSIPFLDYFKTNPKWDVSNPRYGEIDSKNRLKLNLDNIPRNQTVIVFVDTECKVDPEQYLTKRFTPPGDLLSEGEPERMVEIVNNRDFAILGFKSKLRARYEGDRCFQIRLVRPAPGQSLEIPKEFISVSSVQSSPNKIVEWEVDMQPGEIKRFRVTMT